MKAIIIAAGYGTRFLPATKTIPKEMFPLVDTPAIQFILDELEESGIQEVLIVSSRRKKSLEDYLDREIELENIFRAEKATDKLKSIAPRKLNLYFTRQQEMKGTGQAILQCKSFVGNEPFIVAYPDDLVFGERPLAAQLIEVFQKTRCSVLSVEQLEGDLSRYGVIDYRESNEILWVNGIVEKPACGKEPSRMISVGRYLFTSEIFALLEEDYKDHKEGEFYHINAINRLARAGKVCACPFLGERIDVGDKIGYIKGLLTYALQREDLAAETLQLIKKIVKESEYCK